MIFADKPDALWSCRSCTWQSRSRKDCSGSFSTSETCFRQPFCNWKVVGGKLTESWGKVDGKLEES